MPIYGRAFTNTDGPGKPFSGVGPGSFENGVWDYKALPRPGATEHYDSNVIASWSYDPVQRTMVTYDTPEAEIHKSDYIKRNGLGGAMWWECSADKKGNQSLVWTVANALGTSNYSALDRTNNLLNYPQSKYDNLRNQFPTSRMVKL
jgi:chitinase